MTKKKVITIEVETDFNNNYCKKLVRDRFAKEPVVGIFNVIQVQVNNFGAVNGLEKKKRDGGFLRGKQPKA